MAGRAKQWAARLTGLSTPIFGVSWQPTSAERDVAAELLTRLEDRRVLYHPSYAEVPQHCAQSIIEVRHMLSDALAKLGGTGPLAEHVRAMAAASRKFLDRLGSEGDAGYAAMQSPGHYRSWEFLDALGQLRAIFGVHIAMIAASFDLDVRGDLRSLLPAEPADDDLDSQRW